MSFGSFGKPATPLGGTTAPASSPFGQAAQPTGGLFGSASTAPATSLFGGQQQQNTSTPSLFGQQQQQQQQQQPQQTSSLFGGQQGASAGGGLFGSQQASTSTGGLFGQQQNQQQNQQQGTGLFGQQPQQGSSLFGQQQQQPQQQSSFGAGTTPAGGLFGSTTQPSGGGLFGAASTNSATQPRSLFGQQQQGQQGQQGGLFGSQSTTQPSGGLFGQQSTTAPSGGLFGQQNTAQQGGLLGQQSTTQQGGLFGQQQQNKTMFGQQQHNSSLFNKPAQTHSPTSGIGKTRLADLPENVQKAIEQLDAGIKDQKQIGASIDTTNIGRAIWQTSADVKAASDEQAALAQGLYSLRASLEQLATRVNEQATDLQKLLETWEAAKPLERRSPNIRPIAHRDFPQEFFFRVAKKLEERVARYRRNIMLLHRAIVGLANDAEALSPPVVVQTIQNNQAAIISLAAQLDQLQLRMNTLRSDFTNDYREKTHSMRDPFEVAREEKGVSLLRA
ncbi:hypothetical protein CC85DRAFT_286517 [Cutaneotrichosporon oleaginosum]|uniref:Nucleoporin Nup54 alpha-helical domain-containing protein n=1 Tax=Cutaneotrichosporon oleaginosum TaxID=879819 RepID=A0A0J0XJV4_9TREE|nr:uncharacterized protein CC85DRAFT_286517 [Cutaneotrichosporon oleaginosum]KLT41336.1 hypothetical protein CC85DRAFT_286517 [Cutaneotrichosporon oleaginosum]TXT06281.1 hypothetical protein COLE_05612 [Cutaneotrichosporon oleaginosum]